MCSTHVLFCHSVFFTSKNGQDTVVGLPYILLGLFKTLFTKNKKKKQKKGDYPIFDQILYVKIIVPLL